MNSDYVAHLLVARHFGDAGPTKRVKDIVADVVGEGPRRPFDSAMLDVGMDESGDDITGMAELKSELLNMTIELNVDPRHIAQVLKLHQQVGLDRIEGVSMPGPGEDQDEAGDDDAGSAGEGSNGGVE
jgi:hypothetical protein